MVNPHHLAHWYPTAAYLYVFGLDALALAWEYLRRHPDYRLDWLRRHRRPDTAHRWGLRLLEDPALDARDAHPAWLPGHAAVVQLYPDADPSQDAATFAFWRIPGQKQLNHEGKGLDFALELIWSGRRRKDLADNVDKYARLQPRSLPALRARARPGRRHGRGLCPTERRRRACARSCAPRSTGGRQAQTDTYRTAGTAQLAGARRDPGGRIPA